MNSEDLKLDKTPLRFGKYKGKTPDEVSEIDPGWLVWAHKNVKWPVCSQWLYETCIDERKKKPDPDEDIDAFDEADPQLGDLSDDCPF